ncbi:hypothetical protein BFR57_02490 [Idiomarina sp. MD25a]|uniref:hypothetical protein n=1 Tax=Idiomarina sp. MD25a TaxID=1889913 RepID=UPI0008F88595|nr:hypothetical protein [Idiomarina sp. MD25a]OIM99453.1 hypothetical protein BFR57_02490 [Idiomarina sp. MD25a]
MKNSIATIVINVGKNYNHKLPLLKLILCNSSHYLLNFILLIEQPTDEQLRETVEIINDSTITVLREESKNGRWLNQVLKDEVSLEVNLDDFDKDFRDLSLLLDGFLKDALDRLNRVNDQGKYSHKSSRNRIESPKKNNQQSQYISEDEVNGSKPLMKQIYNLSKKRNLVLSDRETTWSEYLKLRTAQNKKGKPPIDQPIFAGLASIPSRAKSLHKVLEKIKDQVDHVFVYLNNYDYIPDCVKCEKVTYKLSSSYKDIAAAGKFYFVEQAEGGYYFSMDDDVIYPDNYIWTMIETLKKYNNSVAVCGHGSVLGQPLDWYFERVEVFNFAREMKSDRFVNLLGTGATGFFYDRIRPEFSDFQPEVMCDLQLSIIANINNIPIVNIKRPKNWFEFIDSDPLLESGNDYFNMMLIDDGLRSELVKRFDWSFEYYSKIVDDFIRCNFIAYNRAQFQRLDMDIDFIQSINTTSTPMHWDSLNSLLFLKRKYQYLNKLKVIELSKSENQSVDLKTLFPNKDSIFVRTSNSIDELKEMISTISEEVDILRSGDESNKSETRYEC